MSSVHAEQQYRDYLLDTHELETERHDCSASICRAAPLAADPVTTTSQIGVDGTNLNHTLDPRGPGRNDRTFLHALKDTHELETERHDCSASICRAAPLAADPVTTTSQIGVDGTNLNHTLDPRGPGRNDRTFLHALKDTHELETE
ncbi:hypothetical protein BX616_005943, partial [Lobosporangium transversale]